MKIKIKYIDLNTKQKHVIDFTGYESVREWLYTLENIRIINIININDNGLLHSCVVNYPTVETDMHDVFNSILKGRDD